MTAVDILEYTKEQVSTLLTSISENHGVTEYGAIGAILRSLAAKAHAEGDTIIVIQLQLMASAYEAGEVSNRKDREATASENPKTH